MPDTAQLRDCRIRASILGEGEVELLPATHRHHPCICRTADGIAIKDDQSGQAVMYSTKEFTVIMTVIPRILSRNIAHKHYDDGTVRFGIERTFDAVTMFRKSEKVTECVEMDVAALDVLRHCRSLLPRS